MSVEHTLNRQPFSAEIDREAEYSIFRLRGDLDADGAQSLRTLFQANISENDKFIIFDMHEVPYINSTALSIIVGLHKYMLIHGGQIFIVRAQSKVKKVFAIMSLVDRMMILDEIETALKMIRSEPHSGE